MSLAPNHKEKTVTAEDEWTDAFSAAGGVWALIFAQSSSFSGTTVTLQCRTKLENGDDTEWVEVETYTANTAKALFLPSGEYRLGCDTGEYGGTAVVCILETKMLAA